MAAAPEYYIRIDSYWQDSPDRFVGAFASREAAETAIERAIERGNVWRAESLCGGDIRDAIRVHDVLSKTAARRAGMRLDNLLGPRFPRDLGQLRAIERANDVPAY